MRSQGALFNTWSLLPGLMLAAPLWLHAAPLELRLCIFDQPLSPMTFPDGCGHSLELLRRASASQPVAIRQMVAPRAQCMTRLRSGEVDAMVAAFMPERMDYAAFPMKDGAIDPARAVGALTFSVSRRRGATVRWDGKQFVGLGRQPVGAQPDMLHMDLLRHLNVVVDDSGADLERMFERLAHNRVAAVVTEQGEAATLIARTYRNEIETLPMPFQQTAMYLAVNKAFYRRHPAQIEAYWTAIGQAARTTGYRQYLNGFRPHR